MLNKYDIEDLTVALNNIDVDHEGMPVEIAIRSKYSDSLDFSFADTKTLPVVGVATVNGKIYLLADAKKIKGEGF